MDNVEKYTFIGDWYDHDATITRKFLVHFFPSDTTVELFDIKNRRTFLRRSIVKDISINDFYISGSVRVYGRLINIVDFGSDETKRKLFKSVERTFAMIKTISNDRIGDVIQCIHDRNFKINQMNMTLLSKETAIQACQSIRKDQNLESILNDFTSGPVIVMELVSENAVHKWLNDMNDINSTVKNKYGLDSKTTLYGSQNIDDALKDLSYFFPTGKLKSMTSVSTASLNNCTCCIIKPHAIRDGNLGRILKAITEAKFMITALKMYYMENVNAAEFYEVYKGVVPDYMGMVGELASGPCVAMEIVGPSDINTPVEFRKLVGPIDPEIARQLRPTTLRARFGNTRIQNAVHCSDLPEDGILEVEYFFKILG